MFASADGRHRSRRCLSLQGEAVGSKAHVTTLRRQRSGAYAAADAWDLEVLVQDAERQGMPRPPKARPPGGAAAVEAEASMAAADGGAPSAAA